MNILVADDYKQSRVQLEEILLNQGHEVITAKDGNEAFERYKENDINVAFIDWSMPEMDGLEVSRKIQAHNSKTGHESYLIMVTAKTKKRNMVDGLESGADDFVLKPYTDEAITSRIDVAKRVLETKFTRPVNQPIEPILILQKEHELIRRMTGVLEVVSNMLSEGFPLPKKLLKWCTSSVFVLNFQLHERREAYYIKAFIDRAEETHGQTSTLFTRSSLGQIMKEHELIEKLLIEMQKQAGKYDIDHRKEVLKLKETITRYLPLIRFHAAREDDVFFPFTQRYFTEDDIEQMLIDFENVEKKIGVEKIQLRMENIEQLEQILRIKNN
jgi:sigma-B regulation protein RsbU (phosphoserine phosphatase)